MQDIPVITVEEETIAEAYETALIKLYNNGCRFKTQYDKPEDPESIDATMNITVRRPLKDPMIHKEFPGGIADLREYVMELQGAKNHWVKNLNDPKDTRWLYTYNKRLTEYGSWREKEDIIDADENIIGYREVDKGYKINQIAYCIDKLIEQPFTRQAQAIIWNPMLDLNAHDSPCAQSLWLRMAEENGEYWLNTNIRIRSNDAYCAFLFNIFGFTIFIKENIADVIAEKTGKKVNLARLNWQADSWHIYGKDIAQAKARLFDRVNITFFGNRVYNFYDPDIQEIYNEATPKIEEKIRIETEKMKAK